MLVTVFLLLLHGGLAWFHQEKFHLLVHLNAVILSLLFEYGLGIVTFCAIIYLMFTKMNRKDWMQLLEPLARHSWPFALLAIVLMAISSIPTRPKYNTCPFCGY